MQGKIGPGAHHTPDLTEGDECTAQLCQMESLGLGCYGCCCLDFGPPRTMQEDIRLNTLRLSNEPGVIERLKRSKATHLTSGLCQFVVELEGGRPGCGIHPAVVGGSQDLRVGFCGHEYICWTLRDLRRLEPLRQLRFREYIREQGLDDHDYSLGLVSGSLMEEFKAQEAAPEEA